VTTTAARYQNLSINQTKLSGQCGRLKCCLNYELDTYLDALQHFPDNAETLQTSKGNASLIKKDIFRNLMWYILPGGTKHYPLTIQRVKEIQRMNARGEQVDELQPVEVVTSKVAETEHAFVDVVGQVSLRSLERTSRRRKDKEDRANRPEQRKGQQRPDNRPQQGDQRNENRNRPQQQRPDNRGQQPPRQDQRNPNRPPQQQRPDQQGGNRPRQQPPGKPRQGPPPDKKQ